MTEFSPDTRQRVAFENPARPFGIETQSGTDPETAQRIEAFNRQMNQARRHQYAPDTFQFRGSTPQQDGFSLARWFGNNIKGLGDMVKGMLSFGGLVTMGGMVGLSLLAGPAAVPFMIAAGLITGGVALAGNILGTASDLAAGDTRAAEDKGRGFAPAVLMLVGSLFGLKSSMRNPNFQTVSEVTQGAKAGTKPMTSAQAADEGMWASLKHLFGDVTGKNKVALVTRDGAGKVASVMATEETAFGHATGQLMANGRGLLLRGRNLWDTHGWGDPNKAVQRTQEYIRQLDREITAAAGKPTHHLKGLREQAEKRLVESERAILKRGEQEILKSANEHLEAIRQDPAKYRADQIKETQTALRTSETEFAQAKTNLDQAVAGKKTAITEAETSRKALSQETQQILKGSGKAVSGKPAEIQQQMEAINEIRFDPKLNAETRKALDSHYTALEKVLKEHQKVVETRRVAASHRLESSIQRRALKDLTGEGTTTAKPVPAVDNAPRIRELEDLVTTPESQAVKDLRTIVSRADADPKIAGARRTIETLTKKNRLNAKETKRLKQAKNTVAKAETEEVKAARQQLHEHEAKLSQATQELTALRNPQPATVEPTVTATKTPQARSRDLLEEQHGYLKTLDKDIEGLTQELARLEVGNSRYTTTAQRLTKLKADKAAFEAKQTELVKEAYPDLVRQKTLLEQRLNGKEIPSVIEQEATYKTYQQCKKTHGDLKTRTSKGETVEDAVLKAAREAEEAALKPLVEKIAVMRETLKPQDIMGLDPEIRSGVVSKLTEALQAENKRYASSLANTTTDAGKQAYRARIDANNRLMLEYQAADGSVWAKSRLWFGDNKETLVPASVGGTGVNQVRRFASGDLDASDETQFYLAG